MKDLIKEYLEDQYKYEVLKVNDYLIDEKNFIKALFTIQETPEEEATIMVEISPWSVMSFMNKKMNLMIEVITENTA